MDHKQERRLVINHPFAVRSIISYGLIVYAQDTGRTLIVQRKHSADFLLIIKGLYRPSNLPYMLCGITSAEASILRKCIESKSHFEEVYNLMKMDPNQFPWACIRLNQSKDDIIYILDRIDLSENQLSWFFPKGRLSCNREIPFECAKREFNEEVECPIPDPTYLFDQYITEKVKISNNFVIENLMWLYIVDTEFKITKPKNNDEVEDRIWVTLSECRNFVDNNDIIDVVENLVLEIS